MSTYKSRNINNLQNKSYGLSNEKANSQSIQLSAVLPAAMVTIILGLWVYACVSSGMYVMESIICSGIILAVGVIKLINSNSIVKSNQK